MTLSLNTTAAIRQNEALDHDGVLALHQDPALENALVPTLDTDPATGQDSAHPGLYLVPSSAPPNASVRRPVFRLRAYLPNAYLSKPRRSWVGSYA